MKKLLVIDDEEDVRITLKEILRRGGYDVEVAADGKEGLEKLRCSDVDLVITDVIMPGIDGVAILNHVRQEHPGKPVIVISGGGNIAPLEYEPSAIKTGAYLASATLAGADATLTKPFERKELLDAVDSLLNAD